jgi:hypothetical protein
MSLATAAAILLALMTMGLTGLASAADRGDATELDNYVRTGETKSCLSARSIKSARILNRSQILFEMRNGARYLNEPRHCGGMRSSQAISYTLTSSSLCSLTIIKLIDPSSPSWEQGACGLDDFQALAPKPAATQ